jgi:mannose-6-phosphate isomerase-like protein (cupin superfamily)
MTVATHAFEIDRVRAALQERGGYSVLHESPGLEVGVYVLVAPEPDRQQPHEDDELYVVLEGRGRLEVEGEGFEVGPGSAVFVPAGAEHRFTGYEGLAVLVIFERAARSAAG